VPLDLKSKKPVRKPPTVRIPITNSSSEAVIATDLSGKIVFWNRMAEEIYGWKSNDVMGRPITDLLVPDSSQPAATEIMEQLRKGESWTGRFCLRRRDGSEFVAVVTDKPMLDDRGNLIGIIGSSRPESAIPVR